MCDRLPQAGAWLTKEFELQPVNMYTKVSEDVAYQHCLHCFRPDRVAYFICYTILYTGSLVGCGPAQYLGFPLPHARSQGRQVGAHALQRPHNISLSLLTEICAVPFHTRIIGHLTLGTVYFSAAWRRLAGWLARGWVGRWAMWANSMAPVMGRTRSPASVVSAVVSAGSSRTQAKSEGEDRALTLADVKGSSTDPAWSEVPEEVYFVANYAAAIGGDYPPGTTTCRAGILGNVRGGGGERGGKGAERGGRVSRRREGLIGRDAMFCRAHAFAGPRVVWVV